MLTPAIERVEHVGALHHQRERGLDAGLVAAVLVLVAVAGRDDDRPGALLRDHGRRLLRTPDWRRPRSPRCSVTTNSRREIPSDMAVHSLRIRFADGLGDCRLRWLSRAISIDTIRDAARTVYDAAVRTPLVPLGVLTPGRPRDLSQARNAAADRLVQDPRRLQRRPPPDPGAARRRRLDRQRRQRRAGRRARRAQGGRALQRHGHGHGPGGQARQHQPSRRDDRQGDLRRVLADGRNARIGADDRTLRPSVRRRRLHQRQRHGRTRDRGRPAGRRRGRRGGRRRRPARRASASRSAPLRPEAAVYAAEPETAAPLKRSLRRAARPAASTSGRRRLSTAPAASRSSTRCGRSCASTCASRSSSRSTRRPRAMKLVAERARVIAEGAGACAVAAADLPGDGVARTSESGRRRVGRQRRSRAVRAARRRVPEPKP